ncbi:MAG TPA: MauE/DoxX family redox-associated membrane protein [Acidobacteriota bacterium]|nr:MauE/DoxX family redox-associated membrane protein [Acidobacteriota bacterium]
MAIKILHWLCRLVLAGVFIYSGYVKLQEPLQFAVAISGYKLVPENLVFPMAKTLPWVEIILGLAVLIGWKIRHFSAATAALLLFFIVVLAITISRGIEANCGCFGLDERISPLTILRDSLFLIPALYLVFEPRLTRRWLKTAPSD